MYSIPSASKLVRVRKAGYEKLKPDRARRKQAVKIFTGPHYGTADTKAKRYINLMRLGVRVLTTNLVPRSPKVDALPLRLGLRPLADALSKDCDNWIEQSKFKHLMRRAVRESILSPCAIIRTVLKSTGMTADIDGQSVLLGDVAMSLIDFDDYVPDPAARCREELSFEAIRYRVRKDEYLSLGILEGPALERFKNLTPLGQGSSDERTGEIAGEEADQYDLFDIVELWDHVLYCGDATYVVTTGDGDSETEYLNVQQYVGAERGPLEVLSYEGVPGCFMPLTPESGLRDLADAVDAVAAKMIYSLKNAKKVHIYARSAEDEALELKRAKDNDHIAVDNVTDHASIDVSGVQEQAYAGVDYFMQKWNLASGNLMTLAGDTAPGKTATEATQNQNNASQYIGDMTDTVLDFESALLRRVAAYRLNDPTKVFTTIEQLQGGITIESELVADPVEIAGIVGGPPPGPEDDIDIGPLGIHVSAASMLPMDPGTRLRRMNEFLLSVAPIAAIPGCDVRALMKIGEENLDIPELSEVFPELSTQPQQIDPATGQPMQGAPGQPPAPGGGQSAQGEVQSNAQERVPAGAR